MDVVGCSTTELLLSLAAVVVGVDGNVELLLLTRPADLDNTLTTLVGRIGAPVVGEFDDDSLLERLLTFLTMVGVDMMKIWWLSYW